MSEPTTPTCGTCDRTAKQLTGRSTLRALLPGWQKNQGLPPLMCSDCFGEWYDNGVTDQDEIKRRVLARTA